MRRAGRIVALALVGALADAVCPAQTAAQGHRERWAAHDAHLPPERRAPPATYEPREWWAEPATPWHRDRWAEPDPRETRGPMRVRRTATRGVEPAIAGGWHPLRIAKWSTLTAALGAAAYGLSASERANDRYDRMDEICAREPGRCAARNGAGGYADPELARLQEEGDRLDRRSRFGLIAGQAGLAASIVLFALDLRPEDSAPNVPYEPARLRLEPGPDGVRLTVRFALPAPRRPGPRGAPP